MPKKVQILLEGGAGNFKKKDPNKKTADKIDIPEEFNKIRSNIKTYANLKKDSSGSKTVSTDQQFYTKIYNEFKERFKLTKAQATGDITWLNNEDKVKIIYEWVKDHFSEKNKYAVNSIYINYHAFANLLLLIDKHNKYFQDIARELFVEGNKIKGKDDKDRTGNNVLTPEDLKKFVPFDNLCLALIRLNEKVKSDENKIIYNIKRLAVALNVLIPPLRVTYANKGCKFHKSKHSPPDDKQNYCWEYKKDKWAFVIQQDKVDQKKERDIFYLDKEIEAGDVHITNGKLLNSYIVDSYHRWPRQYLLPLTNKRNDEQVWSYTTVNASSYDSFINTAIKPFSTNQTMIRESYINWWYHKPGVTNNMQKEIAERMRHSVNVATQKYIKSNAPAYGDKRYEHCVDINKLINRSEQDLIDAPVPNMHPVHEVFLIEPPVKKTQAYYKELAKKQKAKQKERYEKVKERINIKRREEYKKNPYQQNLQKILYNLNHGKTLKPQMITRIRYKLQYDPNIKQWVSNPDAVIEPDYVVEPLAKEPKKKKTKKKKEKKKKEPEKKEEEEPEQKEEKEEEPEQKEEEKQYKVISTRKSSRIANNKK